MAALAQTNSLAAPSSTDLLRDIKPPVDIPGGWEWLWWMLGALLLLAAIAALILYYLRRKPPGAASPPIPAHIRARERLEQALRLLSQPKPFVIAVSDTLRAYLEEQFNFRAPERTTEEFLQELRATPLLDAGQKDSLGNFLQRCDLVKFAKYEPTEMELRDLHNAACRLVEETEPKPEAAPGASVTASSPAPMADSKS